jgi:hypothetical protein
MTEHTTQSRYSFSQPVCFDCWYRLHGDWEPTRLREPEDETCCHCGRATLSGIYVRINPTTVRYPTRLRDA